MISWALVASIARLDRATVKRLASMMMTLKSSRSSFMVEMTTMRTIVSGMMTMIYEDEASHIKKKFAPKIFIKFLLSHRQSSKHNKKSLINGTTK